MRPEDVRSAVTRKIDILHAAIVLAGGGVEREELDHNSLAEVLEMCIPNGIDLKVEFEGKVRG